MAGAFRIAEGYVEVTADESGYDRAMQRLRQAKNRATVTLDIDDTAALAKLRRFADQHSRTVLKATLDAKLNESSIRRVTAQLDRLTADRVVNIRATVDTRVAADEIRNLTQRRRVRIGVDVDTRVAADDIANLTRRRTVRVTADADTTAAAARLAALTRDRTVNIRTRTSGNLGSLSSLGSSAASVGALSSRLASLSSLAIGALPAVASLAQSIASMGPAAAVAAPAILSLASAFAAPQPDHPLWCVFEELQLPDLMERWPDAHEWWPTARHIVLDFDVELVYMLPRPAEGDVVTDLSVFLPLVMRYDQEAGWRVLNFFREAMPVPGWPPQL